MPKAIGKIVNFILMLLLLSFLLNLGKIYEKTSNNVKGENQTIVRAEEIENQKKSSGSGIGDNYEYVVESFYVNGKSVNMNIVTKGINDKKSLIELAQQIKNEYSQEYNSKGYHSVIIEVYENQSAKFGTRKNGIGKIYIAYTEEGEKYLNIESGMKINWTKNEEIIVE